MFKTYCLTCDKYINSVRVFQHLWRKYTPPWWEVVVVGFAPPSFPLLEGVSFLSIGHEKDYPVGKWSNALLKMIDTVPEEIFCFMLEDYWVTEPVKAREIELLYDYMLSNPRVVKMDLVTDRMYAAGAVDRGSWQGMDLILSDPDSAYQMSLMPGFWRKTLWKNYLIPDESPWQVELDGTTRLSLARNDALVMGTKNRPMNVILGHRNGDPSTVLTEGVNSDDVNELMGLGYI